MAIFADLKADSVVQVKDMIRLDARRSFVSKDEAAITAVEIEPEGAAGFVNVTGSSSDDWYLDWAYSTEGDKTVTVRITTDGDPVTLSKTVSVVTEAEDALLSTDDDLIALETDIMNYLPDGKNSYKYIHRKAQSLILDYLDKAGYRDTKNERLTKAAIVDKEPFKTWSKYMALRLIFDDLWNSQEDVFYQKARMYQSLEADSRNRVEIPLDTDGDGSIDESEKIRFDTIGVKIE